MTDQTVCGAVLSLGDDYGDNSCTFTCTLPPGHGGLHREEGKNSNSGKFFVQWEQDARQVCTKCGLFVQRYTRDGLDQKIFCDDCFDDISKEFFKDGGDCMSCILLTRCGYENEWDTEFGKTRSTLIHCHHWKGPYEEPA